MGHTKQRHFEKSSGKFRLNHGGSLRNSRKGRRHRPLSISKPIHVVFKADRKNQKRGFRSHLGFYIAQRVIKTYARRFHVKVEQISINSDHIHILVRLSRRSLGCYFFRVVAGQIAQEFQKNGLIVTDTPKQVKAMTRAAVVAVSKSKSKSGKTSAVKKAVQKSAKLWKHRPFTRIVVGWKAYQIVRNYIQLNMLEASGKRPYRKERLRGLSLEEIADLWR
jgi:hypothetical protein